MKNFSETALEILLAEQPQPIRERAFTVYENYGRHCSLELFGIFSKAVRMRRIDEVLSLLEAHYENLLKSQDPEVRGTVRYVGVNPTQTLFRGILERTLDPSREY